MTGEYIDLSPTIALEDFLVAQVTFYSLVALSCHEMPITCYWSLDVIRLLF